MGEVRAMYKTIELDCQTTKATVTCEDCIAYKTCKARRTREEKKP